MFYLIEASLIFLIGAARATRVCKTFPDYDLNFHCYDNPDGDSEVPGIIARRGYPVEAYEVVTEDDYILTLFRIPSNDSTPVLIQHGVGVSSLSFFAAGNDSIAFLLADEGYDVWLGNSRGSRYGQQHKTLIPDDLAFWNFSYHDVGIFDVKAEIAFIAAKTGKKIRYIGHSMGTTASYVYSITYPEESEKYLEIMIHLAPICFMKNVKSSVGVIGTTLLPFAQQVDRILGGAFFKQTPLIRDTYRAFCLGSVLQMKMCITVMMSAVGFDWPQISPELIPVQLLEVFDASSVKCVMHYSQNIMKDGNFTYYDYGGEGNYEIYGSPEAPSYNLSEIRVPIYLVYGLNDLLAPYQNILRLYDSLPHDVKKHGMWTPNYSKFSHQDFLIAKDVKTLVYDHVIDFMKDL